MKLGKPECSVGDHRSGRLDMIGTEVEVVTQGMRKRKEGAGEEDVPFAEGGWL